MITDGIEIVGTKGEQIKVKRLFAGVVIEQYMTTDVQQNQRKWSAEGLKEAHLGVAAPFDAEMHPDGCRCPMLAKHATLALVAGLESRGAAD